MNILCLDTEHSKDHFYAYEEGFYLTCVGVVNNKGHTDLVWFDHGEEERTEDGVAILQEHVDWADVIVMHNAKHDVQVLKAFGIRFRDTKLHCTMVSEYIIRGQDKMINFSLDDTAARYDLEPKLGGPKEYWDKGIDTYDIPTSILAPYCIKDCEITLDIYSAQQPMIEKRNQQKIIDLHNEFTYCLVEMEMNGFYMDTDRAEALIEEYNGLVEFYVNSIKEMVGYDNVNLKSKQQLSAILYGGILKLTEMEWVITEYKTKPYSLYGEKPITKEVEYAGLGFKPLPNSKLKDGYYSTKKETILKLSAGTRQMREVKKLLIQYSETAKASETLRGKSGKGLLSKIQSDNRIHPKFNQTVTATGRLTSSDPNGQNLPRGNTSPLKRCIRPTLDGIMQVDLSQIEWRDAAWLSQDPTMISEINNGVDQHVATVRDLMELEFIDKSDTKSKENRFNAKIFNFRMIFGGSEWGFYNDIKMPKFTLGKWKGIIKGFFTKYSGLQMWHWKSIKEGITTGELSLPTGRWFKLYKGNFKDGIPVYKENHMRSWPVQGLAGGDTLPLMAVIIRRGMRKLKLESKVILTVHDSIVFDFKESEKEVLVKLCYDVGNNMAHYMQAYYGLDWNIKLECEVEAGLNYGELKYVPPGG